MLNLALLLVDVFVALTAIGGGIALATGLEGNRFSLELLDGTPFHSYRVPSLLLAIVVGGSAALASITLLLDGDAGAVISIVAGILLAGYISVELKILNDNEAWIWTEIFYLAIALLMVLLGLALLLTGR